MATEDWFKKNWIFLAGGAGLAYLLSIKPVEGKEKCIEGYTYDEATQTCVTTPTCPEGQVWDEATQVCITPAIPVIPEIKAEIIDMGLSISGEQIKVIFKVRNTGNVKHTFVMGCSLVDSANVVYDVNAYSDGKGAWVSMEIEPMGTGEVERSFKRPTNLALDAVASVSESVAKGTAGSNLDVEWVKGQIPAIEAPPIEGLYCYKNIWVEAWNPKQYTRGYAYCLHPCAEGEAWDYSKDACVPIKYCPSGNISVSENDLNRILPDYEYCPEVTVEEKPCIQISSVEVK